MRRTVPVLLTGAVLACAPLLSHPSGTHAAGYGNGRAMQPVAPSVKAPRVSLKATPTRFARPIEAVMPTTATNTFVVTTTSDSDCSPNAAVSLRCAITAANASPATVAKVITFNIPTADPNCSGGVCLIQPATDLPPITASSVRINGYTQPGASVNTANAGDNAKIAIQIDGTNDPSDGQAFFLTAGNTVIEGLSLTNWQANGPLNSQGAGNVIKGNFIGVTPAGMAAGNNFGVMLTNATGQTVGGTGAAARNVISGNHEVGVFDLSANNHVLGNLIGTDPIGLVAMPNSYGVVITQNGGSQDISGNVIGGTTAGARNVISGNSSVGVYLDAFANNTMIQRNYIGTDASGTGSLGNGLDGIFGYWTHGVMIGGASSSMRNVISGNATNGVELEFNDSIFNGGFANTIQGNYVGVGVGKVALGNGLNGVMLDNSEAQDLVSLNTIAFNGGNGVLIGYSPGDGDSAANQISQNSTYNNGVLGISMNGLSPVDCLTITYYTFSPQANMPCPAITSASASSAGTTISGTTISGFPVLIEVFLAAPGINDQGHGEGKTYLGSVNTDGTGSTWSVTIPQVLTKGRLVTATASALTGFPTPDTSEFAANVAVQ